MKIIRDINSLSSISKPISLTIGNFDGVHLGHQFLLQHLKDLSSKQNSESLVITFENHPRSVLDTKYPTKSICTLAHKIKLLEDSGIDTLLLLPFTKEFSEQTATSFLSLISKKAKISHLILGEDAVFGKNREGTKSQVFEVAKKLNFHVEYLKQLQIDNILVSSTLIRNFIEQGDFIAAEKYLNRKYSIYGEVIEGLGRGKILGFPTANIDVSNLSLPPLGVYSVTVEYNHEEHLAIANLGFAPTVREEKTARLEIHLLGKEENLYNIPLNAVFNTFIRPEIKFSSLEELKKQIQDDIKKIKN